MGNLNPDYSENIVEIITLQDVVIGIHTADPGLTTDHEATVLLSPIQAYESNGNWAAFVSEGGFRVSFTLEPIDYGEADDAEALTHFTIREQDETTVIYSDALAVPQTTTSGNPVRFPPGSFGVAGGPV